MADDPEAPGWQMRLCANVCGPPIARLRFPRRTSLMEREMPLFTRGSLLCFVLGFVRGYLNSSANLDDFMNGGGTFFSGLLALGAIYDSCMINASFFIMFLVWSTTNAVLFDITFSFLPNLLHQSQYWSAPNGWVPYAFALDNVLLLVGAALQLKLAIQAKAILDDALPDWKNQATYGVTGQPGAQAVAQQPLLGNSFGMNRPQAQSSNNSFRAFSGGGQRLGS